MTMETQSDVMGLAQIFSVDECWDIAAAAIERGMTVEELIRTAVISDLFR